MSASANRIVRPGATVTLGAAVLRSGARFLCRGQEATGYASGFSLPNGTFGAGNREHSALSIRTSRSARFVYRSDGTDLQGWTACRSDRNDLDELVKGVEIIRVAGVEREAG